MDPLTAPTAPTAPTVPTAAPAAAGARPGIRLRWPPGFHELPVAAGTEDRGQRIDALLDALLPADAEYDELRGHAREHYARLADHQQQHGILAAALCNGRIGERVTGAYVSLSLVPLSYPSAEVAALGIYRALAGELDADGEWGRGCGPRRGGGRWGGHRRSVRRRRPAARRTCRGRHRPAYGHRRPPS